MVNKEQIVSMHRSWKETFEEEINELNRALRQMEINCEIICNPDEDGETLIFKKTEF